MKLILTNKNGQTLDLLNNDSRFVLSKCDALHGIETDIATAESPYVDGTIIESVRALPRGIAMTFKIFPDIRENIDFFTSIVKSKQYVTLTETENGREISIRGVATIPPYTRMMAACEIELEIYCGAPYWEDVQTIIGEIGMFLPLLFFPVAGQYFTPTGRPFGAVDRDLRKTFDNDGDVAVGMTIYITALGEVVNPRISCSTGEQNGFYMQLNLTLQQNDEVEICTVRGGKYIKINGSTEYNGAPVLSYLTFNGTDWLQLETGENTFNVTATSGADDVYFTLQFKRRYE